jgi:hypothetical protein
MKPTAKEFENIMFALNWMGHVELADDDVKWLANEIAATLKGERDRCEACGHLHEVIIETALGDICETCIGRAAEEAREVREAQED